MAGSYRHATTKKGKLRDNESFVQMVENLGDAYETVEEMYGMIWWLANEMAGWMARQAGDVLLSQPDLTVSLVEDARRHHEEGIKVSPGKRKS